MSSRTLFDKQIRATVAVKVFIWPPGSANLCDIYLGCSQLYDTRLADDQDEQHDDDPAEEQIVSRHLQQLPF